MSQYRSRSRLNEQATRVYTPTNALSQYRSRSRLNEQDLEAKEQEKPVSQYRSRSRLNELGFMAIGLFLVWCLNTALAVD